MASYDYMCRTCDQVVEVRATFAEKAEGLRPQCPSCQGEDLRRLFTPVGIGSAEPVPAGGGGCCGGGCGCG